MKKLIFIFLFLPLANLIAQPRLLVKDSLQRDINLLQRVLEEVHPGTYRYMTEDQLKAEFQQLYNNLPTNISEADFMIRLAQTVSKVKCGHTYLNPWNMNKALRNRLFDREIFFPIGIEVLDGRFFVTENISEHSSINKGAEILSLNGLAMTTVYDSLRTVAKMDGNNPASIDPYFSVQAYAARDWEAFELYYSLFFPTKDGKVIMEFQNFGADQVEQVTLQLLRKSDRTAKMKEAYGDLSKARKAWKLTILDDQRAILRIGTFAIWNWKDFNYKTWLSEAFARIKEEGIKTLIVDIRANGGGDSDAKDELLSYLVKDKIQRKEDTRSLIRTAKIDEDLQAYCDTWLNAILEGLPKRQYEPYDEVHYLFKKGINKVSINPKKEAFKGQTYILGNGSNTSATYTMLHLAKTYGFAKFIGTESGGNLQGINGSQYVFFYLPYSKMEVDIPMIFSQPTSEMPDRGVTPDIMVKKTQENIALGTDPVLDAAQ